MSFVPGVASTVARGRQYVIAGQSLAVHQNNAEASIPVGDVDAGWIFLGDLDGEPCFARDGEPPADTSAVPLRALFGVLTDDEFGVALRALGVVGWDRDHRHCGRCGAATMPSPTERARTCTSCAHPAYPRISPAVIVRVERDDRILLARNARSPFRFHSVLAGFVEVGEGLEDTVHREIREEAGIEIGDLRYFGSQAWPFTSSLMIGFTARWRAGEIVAEPTEILDADWFAADALPTVPPRLSIARALIDDFVAGGRA